MPWPLPHSSASLVAVVLVAPVVLVDHRVPAASRYEIPVNWKGRDERDGQRDG